jgi:hypothetical protein
MNLEEAIAVMESDEKDFKVIRQATSVIIAAGLCPSCACSGLRNKLGEFQEGDLYEHAGRECPTCGEFSICGPQPEFAEFDTHSDADPGL